MMSWKRNKINKRNRANNSACPTNPDHIFYLVGCCFLQFLPDSRV